MRVIDFIWVLDLLFVREQRGRLLGGGPAYLQRVDAPLAGIYQSHVLQTCKTLDKEYATARGEAVADDQESWGPAYKLVSRRTGARTHLPLASSQSQGKTPGSV